MPKIQYKSLLSDLADLFYPRLCSACGQGLQRSERHICLECSVLLPRTGFGASRDNEAFGLFRGRIQLVQAGSWLYFRKEGRARHLMHDLKYRDNPALGEYLGYLYGTELKAAQGFITPDLITCVPLHPRKRRARGYNQAELIGMGFASALGLPFRPDLLSRTDDAGSQTRKKRYARWENSSGLFLCQDIPPDCGHLAVLDDVITTGSTLEACCTALAQKGVKDLSVFSLCLASA